MTTTTRTRKSRAKVAPVVAAETFGPVQGETPMVSLAGVGALVHDADYDRTEVQAEITPWADGDMTDQEIAEIPEGDIVVVDGEPEVKTFTITGEHVVDGTKVAIVVEAVAPVAFVKVGAKRVGKAHLVVTESDTGSMALTYVNRRGESRNVTEAQFIAIYKSGITTPIDVPVRPVPVVAQTPEAVQQEISELLELLAPVDIFDGMSTAEAASADLAEVTDFGPTEADMALLAEEIEMAEIDGPGAETVTFEH